MRRPEVRFLDTAYGAVAFQTWSDGDRAILNLSEWVGSVENSWEHPAHLRLWEIYGSIGRGVRFDYPGLGMSDPVDAESAGDPASWAACAVDVLDHLGIGAATVIGEGAAAAAALLLAVEHPDRVERLALSNCSPCGAIAAGVPAARTAATAEWVRRHWGTGQVVAAGSRDLGEDLRFAARMERIGARPSVAGRMIEVGARQDVRPLLPEVTVETLVLHTGDLTMVPRERTQAVAEAIPGATFSDAQTTSFYWGAEDSSFVHFLSGGNWGGGERDLAVVAFTDIVRSTEQAGTVGDEEWRRTLDLLDSFVTGEVEATGGRVVKQTGDGHLLEFPRPGVAIAALASILQRAPAIGLHLRAGAHLGEIERRSDGDIGGIAVHICARISALASAGELLVSSTVADTAAGGSWTFTDLGVHELRGISSPWRIHAVSPR